MSRVGAAAALCALTLVPTGCTTRDASHTVRTASSAPVRGGTLVFGRGLDAIGLDPAHEDDAESFKVTAQIFDTLVRHPNGGFSVEPWLATRWDSTADGKEWTFHLRRGVRFHDGTPLNADAVVFSLMRQRAVPPLHPLHSVGGPYKLWVEFGLDDVVGDVRAVDDSTVRFTLRKPFGPFLGYLAGDFASIVSPTAARRYRDDFFKHPVGSGPFRFVEWVKDDHITLAANHEYWRGAPYLERVVIRSIPENNTRYQELTAGDLDAMDGVNPDVVARVQHLPGFQITSAPGANVAYLAINNDKPPFTDVRVRRALNMAIDVDALVATWWHGFAVRAVDPLPPGMWGHDPSVQPYPHDPEEAKRLLSAAGYPRGFDCELWSMSGPRYYMPEPQRVAESIQADLARIGVRARIRTFEWGTYLDAIERGRHQLALIGSGTVSGDPDEFTYGLFDKDLTAYPAGNLSYYRSEAVHHLVTRARLTMDQSHRAVLYAQAARIIRDDAPWVPIAHASELAVERRGVHDLVPASVGNIDFSRVWVDAGASVASR